MNFLQAINSDISVLVVCNKTGGTIKGDKQKKTYQQTRDRDSQSSRKLLHVIVGQDIKCLNKFICTGLQIIFNISRIPFFWDMTLLQCAVSAVWKQTFGALQVRNKFW